MKLEIWFEFASTYSYLSVSRIEELVSDTPIELVWRPFLLGPIFRDRGWETSPFIIDPVKGAYMWRDLERRCEKHSLAFTRPPVFPVNGLQAARIMTAALDAPWCGDFARDVFAAQFGRGVDISDERVLRHVLEDCGAVPDDWIAKAQLGATKSKLRETVDQARALGIFGAPSFVTGDELFWGDDRLEDAIAFACDLQSRGS